MPHPLLSFIATLTLGIAAAAAPVPDRPAKVIPFEFPTRTKTAWKYQKRGSIPCKYVVLKAERQGETTVLSRQYMVGVVECQYYPLLVSPKGVTEAHPDGDRPFLVFPLRAGATWTGGDTTYTVRGLEPVAVPAGTYDAVRVDEETAYSNETVRGINWWVSGVGLVKQVRSVPGEEPVVTVLELFTPGK